MTRRLLAVALTLSTSQLSLLSAGMAAGLEFGSPFPGESREITTDADFEGIVVGGDNAGDVGTLVISGGAHVTSKVAYPNYGLRLGPVTGSAGIVSVTGAGTTLTVNETTAVGSNGTGALLVGDGAHLETVRTTIGDSDQHLSTMIVFGEGTSWHSEGGGIHVENGTLAIGGGADLTLTGTGLYVSGGGSVEITGAGSSYVATIVDPEMGPSFNMDGGNAIFSDGARIVTASGYIGVSNSATPASLTVTGPGTTWDTYSWLYVGGANGGTGDGVGTMTISDGAKVTGRSIGVGMDTESIGLLVLTGEGSSLTARRIEGLGGNFYIGYAGQGEVVLSGGATLDVGGSIYMATETASSAKLYIGAKDSDPAAAAGHLSAGSIIFGDGGSRQIFFNHTDDDYDFDVALSGYAQLVHLSGDTTFSGDASAFYGSIVLQGGNLTLASDFSRSDLTAPMGTLSGAGTLKQATILHDAVHSIAGDAIGTQTVLNSYVNQGTLVIDVDTAGSDQLITGTDGSYGLYGTRLVVRAGASLDGQILGRDYVIIDGVGDSGSHSVGIAASAQPFIDITVANGGNNNRDAIMTLSRNATSFASLAETANQRAVASAADLSPDTAAQNLVLLSSDAEGARIAYDQLSGEVHSDMRAGFVTNSRVVRDTMNQRLMAPVQDEDTTELGYWPGLDLPFAEVLASPSTQIWGTLYGSRGNLAGDGNATSVDTSSAGLLMGIEGTDGDWRLGLSGGIGAQGFTTGQGSTGESADIQLGAYGGTFFGGTALRIGGNLAVHGVETSRTVAIGVSGETLEGRYAGVTGQLFAEIAHEFDLRGARLAPFVNAAYIGTATSAFTETGGTTALNVAAAGRNTLLAVLGLRGEADLTMGDTLVTASGMLGWQHAMGDLASSSANSFGGGSNFSVSGTSLAEESLLLDLGLSTELTPGSTVSAGYRGEFSDNGRGQTLFGRFQQDF